MNVLSFADTPLGLDLAVFAVAAAAVWIAGWRLAGYADDLARLTGAGQALVGILVLGLITSLPEVAVTVTASITGNSALAINNLLGGVPMQVAILAVADAAIGRDALSSVIVDPSVLLQAVFCILLLVLVAGGVVVGEVAWLGIGAWAWAVAVVYGLAIWTLARYPGPRRWVAEPGSDGAGHQRATSPRVADGSRSAAARDEAAGPTLSRTVWRIALAAIVVLVAGIVLARTGEAIAEKSGLGQSFVGAVLVAISTSLPELSTVLGAVRRRLYSMAVSDIFGTNLADLLLVFVVDLTSRGGPVLEEVGVFSTVAALLGIAVTVLYIAGLVERRDRTVLRMGYDSAAVLVTYVGGLLLLYRLR